MISVREMVLTSVPQFLPGQSGQDSWTPKALTNSGVFYSEQEARGPWPQGDKKNPVSVEVSSGYLAGSPAARYQVPEGLPSSVGPVQGAGRKLCKIRFPHPKALNPSWLQEPDKQADLGACSSRLVTKVIVKLRNLLHKRGSRQMCLSIGIQSWKRSLLSVGAG